MLSLRKEKEIQMICYTCRNKVIDCERGECLMKDDCPYADGQCKICDGLFSRYDDFYDGYCYDCAEDAYTDTLGYQFIRHKFNRNSELEFSLEDDFISQTFPNDKIISSEAISAIINEVEMGVLSSDEFYCKALKDYALKQEDLMSWIDFLNDIGYE